MEIHFLFFNLAFQWFLRKQTVVLNNYAKFKITLVFSNFECFLFTYCFLPHTQTHMPKKKKKNLHFAKNICQLQLMENHETFAF